MARKFKQLRFYNSGSNGQNEPGDISGSELINAWSSGNIVSSYLPIVQLGITAPPGTKFYINGGTSIVMGYTGLFELDLTGTSGTIDSLRFDIGSLNLIDNNNAAQIYVDLVYEGGAS